MAPNLSDGHGLPEVRRVAADADGSAWHELSPTYLVHFATFD